MKQTRILMGMPVTVEILDRSVNQKVFLEVFRYFKNVENRFSPFSKNSEVGHINERTAGDKNVSPEMAEIIKLAEITKKETDGYFDVWHDGKFNPSGIVKGWAIQNAAKIIKKAGFKYYYVEAGGDIEASTMNGGKCGFRVGIRNPLKTDEIVKVVEIKNQGIATSGAYFRGDHIYNPNGEGKIQKEVLSMTIIGREILDADRFATAAFAMGREGINFVENHVGFEGYMIDESGIATYTSGFNKFVAEK